MFRSLLLLGTTLALSILTGCASLLEGEDETKGWSAGQFYTEAKAALADGDYERAIEYYEGLQARYPFGTYAQQALLDMAYAYYKFEEPDSAIATADRFIRLYPRHPNIDYAYYLKGLVNFNRGTGLLERYLPQDTTQRDPGPARDSFSDFSTLLARFPNSRYAEDARQRMIHLRNRLALYEIHVASYYMERGAYVAAASRANGVVKNYPKTSAVPYALRVAIDAYTKLELPELASDARRVLQLNYPEHRALTEGAYLPKQKADTLFARFWNSLGLDR